MYANVDESQTNVDECRGVFRQVQRNVDEFFPLIPKKATHGSCKFSIL